MFITWFIFYSIFTTFILEQKEYNTLNVLIMWLNTTSWEFERHETITSDRCW